MTLIIHPGYPKAASTSLQEQVFKQASGVNFVSPHASIDRCDGETSGSIEKIRHLIRGPNSDNRSDCRRNRPREAKAISHDEHGSFSRFLHPDRINVFSDETLLMPHRCEHTPASFPGRLRALFGTSSNDTRVLLVLRNQVDLMYSFYVQKYPKLRNIPDHQNLREYYFDRDERLRADETVGIFDFDQTLKSWEDEFNPGSITVLLFEELRDNPSEFSRKLAEAIDADPNEVFNALDPSNAHRVRSRTRAGYEVEIETFAHRALSPLRKMAKYLLSPGWKTYLAGLSRHYLKKNEVVGGFSDHQSALIRAQFSESNARIMRRYDLPHSMMKKHRYISA